LLLASFYPLSFAAIAFLLLASCFFLPAQLRRYSLLPSAFQ